MTVEAATPDWAHEIQFVEVREGRVHVVAHERKPAAEESGPNVIDFLMGATYTRCGRRILKNVGGQEQSAWPAGRFADDRLCQQCAGSVPSAERWRLFEHAQPDDPEED